MILVFDTETTGLPTNDPLDDPAQPWPVQLGAVLIDPANDFHVVSTLNTIVRPPVTCVYSERAVATHGLTPEMVEAKGLPHDVAYELLYTMARKADVISAYNIAFDKKIMEAARLRTNPELAFFADRTELCAMIATQRRLGFRAKLGAAYKKLTGKEPMNAHDAMGDVLMTVEILKALWTTQKK